MFNACVKATEATPAGKNSRKRQALSDSEDDVPAARSDSEKVDEAEDAFGGSDGEIGESRAPETFSSDNEADGKRAGFESDSD